jgi:hypothetical protein
MFVQKTRVIWAMLWSVQIFARKSLANTAEWLKRDVARYIFKLKLYQLNGRMNAFDELVLNSNNKALPHLYMFLIIFVNQTIR